MAPWTGPLPAARPSPSPPAPAHQLPADSQHSGWQPPSATPLPPVPASAPASTAGWAPISSPVAAWTALGTPPPAGTTGPQPFSAQLPPASFGSQHDTIAPRASEEDAHRTWVSLLVNPAMAPWGRTSGRIEFAPLPAHAVYFEFSKINFFVKNIGREVPVYEYDFGYHLYPQGRGVSGFYLGPRVILARGETEEAIGKATGIGADLGYQLVIARHFVVNAGIGAAHFTASAEARPGWEDKLPDGISPDQAGAFGASLSFGETVDLWLPLATLGLGLAF